MQLIAIIVSEHENNIIQIYGILTKKRQNSVKIFLWNAEPAYSP